MRTVRGSDIKLLSVSGRSGFSQHQFIAGDGLLSMVLCPAEPLQPSYKTLIIVLRLFLVVGLLSCSRRLLCGQSAVDLNVSNQGNLTLSDHFISSASFLRVDHITIGYDLKALTNKNIRVYSTIQNPILITGYDGLDPETGNGIDNNIYPRPRTLVFGVSAQF